MTAKGFQVVANGGAEYVRQLIIANPAEGGYAFSTWHEEALARFDFLPQWGSVLLVGFPLSSEENNKAVAKAIADAGLEFYSTVEGWNAYGATIISVDEIEGHRADLLADAGNTRSEFHSLTTEAIGNNIANGAVKNALVEYFLRGDENAKAIAEKAQAEYREKVQAVIDRAVATVLSAEPTKGVYSCDLTTDRTLGLEPASPSKIAGKLYDHGARAVVLTFYDTFARTNRTYVAVNTRIEEPLCTDVREHLGEGTDFGGVGVPFTVSVDGDKLQLATETLVGLA